VVAFNVLVLRVLSRLVTWQENRATEFFCFLSKEILFCSWIWWHAHTKNCRRIAWFVALFGGTTLYGQLLYIFRIRVNFILRSSVFLTGNVGISCFWVTLQSEIASREYFYLKIMSFQWCYWNRWRSIFYLLLDKETKHCSNSLQPQHKPNLSYLLSKLAKRPVTSVAYCCTKRQLVSWDINIIQVNRKFSNFYGIQIFPTVFNMNPLLAYVLRQLNPAHRLSLILHYYAPICMLQILW
jgi:hypothetical protein